MADFGSYQISSRLSFLCGAKKETSMPLHVGLNDSYLCRFLPTYAFEYGIETALEQCE